MVKLSLIVEGGVYTNNVSAETANNVEALRQSLHKFFTNISTTTNALQHNMSAKSLVKTKIPGMKFKSVHYPTTDIRTLVSCYSNGKKIILD